jgi:hypothetical protein
MISSSFLVLFVKPSIVLCWLDRRICTKREIEIADIVNNSIKSESFVTTLVPMITDAIQHNLELTIRQTIAAVITTSMTDIQNIGIGLPVGVLIVLSLVCRVFGPTECDSLRCGCRSLCLISSGFLAF